jgi:hypothetical protein
VKIKAEGAVNAAAVQAAIKETKGIYKESFGYDPNMKPADIRKLAAEGTSSDAAKVAILLAGFSKISKDLKLSDPRDLAKAYATDALDGAFDGSVHGAAVTLTVNGAPIQYADATNDPLKLALNATTDFMASKYAPAGVTLDVKATFTFTAKPPSGAEFAVSETNMGGAAVQAWYTQNAGGMGVYEADSGTKIATAAEMGFVPAADGVVKAPPVGCDLLNFDKALCEASMSGLGFATKPPTETVFQEGGFSDTSGTTSPGTSPSPSPSPTSTTAPTSFSGYTVNASGPCGMQMPNAQMCSTYLSDTGVTKGGDGKYSGPHLTKTGACSYFGTVTFSFGSCGPQLAALGIDPKFFFGVQ